MPTRPEQLAKAFEDAIDAHLADLVNLRATEMLEIEAFAIILNVHPVYLSNLVKETRGTSPCGIYQQKIIGVVRELLANPQLSIKSVALTLDFEPSQFTKWFKRFHGISPKAYQKMSILK